MYNLDIDKKPTQPLITSQLSANIHLNTWVKENDYTKFRDGNNQIWDVKMAQKELPDPNNAHKLIWQLTVQLVAEPTVSDFINTNVLDPIEDERLINLLSNTLTPLAMKPKIFLGHSPEELMQSMNDYLPQLKEDLVALDLKAVKKKLISRWLDSQTEFTSDPL